jgi:hypothetical protein
VLLSPNLVELNKYYLIMADKSNLLDILNEQDIFKPSGKMITAV